MVLCIVLRRGHGTTPSAPQHQDVAIPDKGDNVKHGSVSTVLYDAASMTRLQACLYGMSDTERLEYAASNLESLVMVEGVRAEKREVGSGDGNGGGEDIDNTTLPSRGAQQRPLRRELEVLEPATGWRWRLASAALQISCNPRPPMPAELP
jgi:hypothetical protein